MKLIRVKLRRIKNKDSKIVTKFIVGPVYNIDKNKLILYTPRYMDNRLNS